MRRLSAVAHRAKAHLPLVTTSFGWQASALFPSSRRLSAVAHRAKADLPLVTTSFGWQASALFPSLRRLQDLRTFTLPERADLANSRRGRVQGTPQGATSRFLHGNHNMIAAERRFVYVLRSERCHLLYVGVTSNVSQRLGTHNTGGSSFTAPHRPWRLAAAIELPTEPAALEFERYLKSGSGRAFANRHFR